MNFRLPEVSTWMFDHALPLWATAGQDKSGRGFAELLDRTGRPLDPGFKRIRVQARQIYTFCHAVELGWQGPALEAAIATGSPGPTTHPSSANSLDCGLRAIRIERARQFLRNRRCGRGLDR